MSDLRYWLALNFLSDIGPVLARRLVAVFGNPENIFQMPISELKKVGDIGENRAMRIVGFKQWDMIQKEIENAVKNDVRMITVSDEEYPEGIRRINDAPLVLYIKGEIKHDDRYAIAIVGARRATDYGLRVAEEIGSKLATYGLTVVSGMARGIDAASHRAVLRANGRTIAVLGSGIDVPYPPENKGLMNAISSSGAVISEFPFGTKPNKENFPRRNRIISALSMGVVVVEATVDSGSLITVGYALEQNKEVFAVPGNITSKNSKGTNELIKKGAKLVESAEEIIDELRPQIKGILSEQRCEPYGSYQRSISEKTLPMMTDDEKLIYNCLCNEPKHVDVIIREAHISSSKALSILLNLELKGVVRQVEGKNFSIN